MGYALTAPNLIDQSTLGLDRFWFVAISEDLEYTSDFEVL
jgi:hypothetical protein